MKGHEPLFAMRLQGWAPKDVHIDTSPSKLWREWQVWSPDHAHLVVEPSDSVRLLDLRCVVGLLVFVNGSSHERVAEVIEAAKKAGARRVVGFVHPGRLPEEIQILDTEGALQ